MNTPNRAGFTLIELLVVVGIIGLLAAIAVPNYHDAVIRSRVAQVKIELKNLGYALQNYRMDHNLYPRKDSNLEFFAVYLFPELTTPIPYLGNAQVNDPFGPVVEFEEQFWVESPREGLTDRTNVAGLIRNSYIYIPYVNYSFIKRKPMMRREGFAISSVGPDQMDSYIVQYPFPQNTEVPIENAYDFVYNPSNGIRSTGDIGFFGGDIPKQGLVGG